MSENPKPKNKRDLVLLLKMKDMLDRSTEKMRQVYLIKNWLWLWPWILKSEELSDDIQAQIDRLEIEPV